MNDELWIRVSWLIVLAALGFQPPAALAANDFGVKVEKRLNARSDKLFGIVEPLAEPADEADYVPREEASAQERILLAKGLKAEFVARNMAMDADMIAFWPNEEAYTHLILCIEQGRAEGGRNASIQRVNVATGEVETILYGMSRCDGIRTTPWGTILATEETDDGRAYEVLDPLNTTGHWVADRASGEIRDRIGGSNPSTMIAQRSALPTMAWEGLTVLESGVVIGGDELRPGSEALDTDGGAIFKFVPFAPRTASGVIGDLAQSPLTSGSVYAMTISCRDKTSADFPQYGQGCEVGQGAWVKVNAETARIDANANGATGYYRPEDLHRDIAFKGEGVRFCWTNTGNESAENYGEVLCAIDNHPLGDGEKTDERTGLAYLADLAEEKGYAVVAANRFFEGDPRFNSVDNLAIQPKTGLWYVVEDHQFGEVFACLRDGADRDIKTDGCISVLSVIDPEAEPTGFIFDGSGKAAYLVLQHGEQPDALKDFTSNPVDGTTDDLIKITGFKIRKGMRLVY